MRAMADSGRVAPSLVALASSAGTAAEIGEMRRVVTESVSAAAMGLPVARASRGGANLLLATHNLARRNTSVARTLTSLDHLFSVAKLAASERAGRFEHPQKIVADPAILDIATLEQTQG